MPPPKSHEEMIVNMLDLEKVKIEDAMIPRSELIAVDIELDIEDITKSILNCKHTRIPIYESEFNKLLGFLHKRKIIEMLVDGKITKEKIIDNVNPPYFIPEDTSLTSQLIEFKKERKRIGFVVDEYGDVKGVVTLDDILEEIVGNYTDISKGDGISKLNDKINIDYDQRKDLYENVKSFTMGDLTEFHNTHVKNDNYTYMVLASLEELDMQVLKTYGEVNVLTLEDIFGY